MKTTRREILQAGSCAVCSLLTGAIPQAFSKNTIREPDERFIREAKFYEKLPFKKIKCKLCPRECEIDDLERGYCGVRENRGGIYYTMVYSRPCSAHIDPIEKKPLFHFLPGSTAFSIATAGCNVECKFCQNWEISQKRPEEIPAYYLPPAKVADMTAQRNVQTIAYTYTEPVVYYEYMYDCAKTASRLSIKSVMISNGFIQKQPMEELSPYLDGVKIDLKAFTDKFYKDLVAGELKPVLDTIVSLKKQDVWTEIVYLVIPGYNDSEKETKELSAWVKNNLGNDVPVHFSRFYPMFRLKNVPPTPVKTLERAREILLADGLHYVYIGNVPGHPGENTYCPECGEIAIKRSRYSIERVNMKNGKHTCGCSIPGVWK